MKNVKNSPNCAETAFRLYDFMAFAMIGLCAIIIMKLPSQMGDGMYKGDVFKQIFMAALGGGVMIGALIASKLRNRQEGDEFLLMMAGKSALAGLFCSFTFFVIWSALTPGLLPSLKGDWMFAVLISSSSLAWLYYRWKSL